MKRLFYLLSVLLAVSAFVACSGKGGKDNKDTLLVQQDSADVHGIKRMQVSKSETDIQFKGKDYHIFLSRTPSDSLPHVNTEMGDEYLDNQIVSIDLNAKQIGNTIVEGFFKTIRTEISQQIMELSQQINSNLMHLRELAKACEAKKKQMEVDYNRKSNQYLKIFDDLNKELENRIFELNKPAFIFKRNSDNHTARTSGNDLVSTVAVFGKEGGELQAKISTSIAKKRALDTINQVNVYLWKQKKTENAIAQSMLNSNVAASIFAPVCFLETVDEKNQINKKVYQSSLLSQINSNNIIENIKAKSWTNIPKESKESIQRYFNTEISNSFSSNDLRNNRVKDMVVKLLDLSSTKNI